VSEEYPCPVIKGLLCPRRRLGMMKKMLHISILMTIVLFGLLPFIFTLNQPAAEAAKLRVQTAIASWTKCTDNVCVDTVILATDRVSKKSLSFEETTYRGNGDVVFRRGGFATKNVNFQQTGLEEALVDAYVKVDLCNAQDVCETAGTVHVTAFWEKNQEEIRVDPEDNSRLRDATVTGSVDFQDPGSLRYAVLAENG
jgi:hypothetical protein